MFTAYLRLECFIHFLSSFLLLVMASVLMSQPAAGLPAPAVTSKRANKVLAGQYEVSVKLGAGLQGQVYLGKDMQSGNLVALKCMDRAAIEANPKVMQNVERELQAMTKVSEHSGVVQALDIKWKAEWPRSNGGVKVRGNVSFTAQRPAR